MQAQIDQLEAGLGAFETWLGGITDAELHLADPEGGWTVAQIVSHIQLSATCWIAAVARADAHEEQVLYREELGHDAVGAPPWSTEEAIGRVASARRGLAECLRAAPADRFEHRLAVRPFPVLTLAQLNPGIIGHLLEHAEQAKAIIATRRG